MKQNNHNRQNRRFNNRNNRPTQTIYRNTCLDSSGPAGKLRGTPLQLNEKYAALAKDASTANDMILAEQYRQYADHYMRLQNLAIENENALRASREAQQAPAENEEATPAVEELDAGATEQPTDNLSVPVQQMNEQSNLETE
ncbi:MAG: DUF4167 domain-containing protein [Alphaproteobacteria bacterium]|nr:DUF4167 domain-containing protein [Alphaproteobacteria bacterium]